MGRRIEATFWIVAATMLGWSLFDHVPYVDLDRSWAHGLHLVHLEGHRFGDDVVFNYGPLGFIARPVAGTGAVYALGVLGTLVLTVIAAVLVYATLVSMSVRHVVVGPATAAIMLVAPFENLLVETLLVLGAVALVRARAHTPTGLVRIAALAGVSVVALALIKVSVGLPGLFVVVVTTWVSVRATVASIVAMGTTLLVVWVGTGQSLRDLLQWLRGTAELASGHVSAMNVGDGSRWWEYVVVAVIVVIGAVLVFDAKSRRSLKLKASQRASTVVAVAVAVIIGWFVFRQGFTLHGPRTRLAFFAAAWILVGLAPWRRLSEQRRIGLVALTAVAACCFVIAAGSLVRLVNPLTPVGDAVESARLVLSSGYRDMRVEDARRQMRVDYGVPASIIDRIGETPVLIDPYEISAAWAYDLEWVPLPTIQRYLGYTEYLDQLNAQLLGSARAPQFVLRQRFAVIQQRYAPAESPSYVTDLFCNYRVVDTSDRWDLLERSANRCGKSITITTQRVNPGEVVEIPRRPGAATLFSVDFDDSLRNRVASMILKPFSNPHIEINDQRFRMLPATSSSPALIYPGDAADWDEGTGLVADAQTLTVDTPADITFYAVPVEQR